MAIGKWFWIELRAAPWEQSGVVRRLTRWGNDSTSSATHASRSGAIGLLTTSKPDPAPSANPSATETHAPLTAYWRWLSRILGASQDLAGFDANAHLDRHIPRCRGILLVSDVCSAWAIRQSGPKLALRFQVLNTVNAASLSTREREVAALVTEG
jgi:hypothetical protein